MANVETPPGVPEDRKYEEIAYCGANSWVISLCCGVYCCVPCCRCDKKDFYVAPNEDLYKKSGTKVPVPFCMKR